MPSVWEKDDIINFTANSVGRPQFAINFKYDSQDNFHLWSDITGHLVKVKLSFLYNKVHLFNDFLLLCF